MFIIIKILFLLFFLSSLNILRHIYYFIQSYLKEERYVLDRLKLFLLGTSIAFILMSIFTGIGI